MKKHNTPKNRTLSLIRTLGSTALKAGNEVLKRKISQSIEDNTFISDAAVRLAKGLDDLKGAAMKAGQLLSMVDESILPPGWKDALAKLQSHATAKDWSFIEPILLQEFGSLEDFEFIEHQAIHAASIGQVHKGRLKDGTSVAVKVQYPNLEASVKSDLKSMKKVIKIANLIPNLANYDAVFDAVEHLFMQELDFIREKNYYNLYHERFKSHPNIIVPKTIDQYCTKHVLVTEWVEAESLQDWLTKNSQEMHSSPDIMQQRDKLGQILLDLVFTEIFELHHIQSDPNPANFLVTSNADLVLLDFGATQKLSDDTIENYTKLTQAAFEKKHFELTRFAKKMGFLTREDPPETQDSFIKIMEIVMEPFQAESYSWKNCHQLKRINSESLSYMKLTKFRAPTSEIIFINRRLGGNLIIMEKLGATVCTKNVMCRILQKNKE